MFLETKSEIKMVELKLAFAEEEENALFLDTCKDEVVGEENLSGHLSDSRTETEPTIGASVHSTTEVSVNCRVDLLKVEPEFFIGKTSSY